MSSKFKKMIKCLIAFSFIFTIVGCGSSKEKTNKEVAEIIKNDKKLESEVSLFKWGGYSSIKIKGDKNYKKGVFSYHKDGTYSFRKNYDDYDFTKKVKKKDQKLDKQCEKFLDEYNLTKSEVKKYLKYIYTRDQKEFDKLSDKDKILTANKDQKEQYESFLNNKKDEEISDILNFMKNDYGSYQIDYEDFYDYYCYRYYCPKEFNDIYKNLYSSVYSKTGAIPVFKKYSEDNGTKAVFFDFSAMHCGGYYSFSVDANGKVTYAMIINEIKETDGLVNESYKLSGHLISAVTGKDIDECESIAIKSFNVVYPVDDYTCTLTIMNSQEIGFAMIQK